MNTLEILKTQRNRYPVLFIDRMLAVEPGKSASAIKCYTYNEWFFPAHFDDEPNVQNELANEIRIHQLEEKVCLLGFQSNIIKLLKKCSILVVSSKSEGMPNVVLEAMSIGRPIITTDTTGCKETVVNGVNGLLIPIKDKKSLVIAIKNIILVQGRNTLWSPI